MGDSIYCKQTKNKRAGTALGTIRHVIKTLPRISDLQKERLQELQTKLTQDNERIYFATEEVAFPEKFEMPTVDVESEFTLLPRQQIHLA